MRKLLNRKIVDQDRKCAIGHEEFTDYDDLVPYADIGIRSQTTGIAKEWEELERGSPRQYPDNSLLTTVIM